MAHGRTLSTLALAALLGAAACGDIDAGNNNEDAGVKGGDLTPGDTRDGGSGTTYTVSADTSTPKTAEAVTNSDSLRNAASTATGDSVAGERPPASGQANAGTQPPNAGGGTPQPPTQGGPQRPNPQQ